MAPPLPRAARTLARRVPPVAGLLSTRDRWRDEALRRRRTGAALQARVDADAVRLAELEAELARSEAHYARLRRQVGPWLPGHYYSPIPDLAEVRAREDELWAQHETLPGIDFRPAAQLALLPVFAELSRDQPFPDEPAEGFRYSFLNHFFAHPDGLVYHCLLRMWQPRRVLEIGSGWSSALLLDTRERFLPASTELTFVEPYTERLDELLRPVDRATTTVLEQPLKDVGPEVFDRLEAGDVLFIDSTHVSKIGSDVNRLLLEVLPTLPAGVHVHVHDVFHPFEYEKPMVFAGRAWNEAYLLRALLIDNPTLQVTWANSYMRSFHAAEVAAAMPAWARGHGGSIWLKTLPGPTRRA